MSETTVKHKLETHDEEGAKKTANMWLDEGYMVEIRPPAAISGDGWYIYVLEWSE